MLQKVYCKKVCLLVLQFDATNLFHQACEVYYINVAYFTNMDSWVKKLLQDFWSDYKQHDFGTNPLCSYDTYYYN